MIGKYIYGKIITLYLLLNLLLALNLFFKEPRGCRAINVKDANKSRPIKVHAGTS